MWSGQNIIQMDDAGRDRWRSGGLARSDGGARAASVTGAAGGGDAELGEDVPAVGLDPGTPHQRGARDLAVGVTGGPLVDQLQLSGFRLFQPVEDLCARPEPAPCWSPHH
jgi:hypothetical protein